MEAMETSIKSEGSANANTNTNQNSTQSPSVPSQAPAPTPSSSAPAAELQSSPPSSNPSPNPPLQQAQPQPQHPSFLNSQQKPPIGRPRPPYTHFAHLPPSSSSSSSSSPAVSGPSMPRGGLAISVPAGHRPQQPPGSFSTFGSPHFNPQFGGLGRNSPNLQDQIPNSGAQGRQPVQGIQTIGMMGSLGSGSQLRPSGAASGHHPSRPGQPQLRTQSPSNNQSLATQKFQGPGMMRVQSMASPNSQSPGTPQGSQQHTQPWMKGQMHMSSVGPSSTFRPHMKPQTLQQRPHQPQQHHLTVAQHSQQISSSQQQQQQQQQQQHQSSQLQQPQEQHGQQYLPGRVQQPTPHQQPAARTPASTGQKSVVPATMQPGTVQSMPTVTVGANAETAESGNQILSKRTIHELVSQVDPAEKLDPEVEDVLIEIAEDFVESITTVACSLAKHRKSTTLEAKDILLHLERAWNMTLPGFSGDEIKSCKKPFMNDIHRERLTAIKKSVVGAETGGTKNSAGQASGNPKAHTSKAPPANT